MDNLAAFLDMTAVCEGTGSEYRALFGYTPQNRRVFDDFRTHPNIKMPFTDKNDKVDYSTAAGRFQEIWPTFVRLSAKLGTTDFSPATQDAHAAELIAEAGAMADVKNGNLQAAIDKCSKIWASLPASTYPQPERSYLFATEAFLAAGGTVA